jgi:CP family cyanate transporter-like MFS transporter
MPWVDVMRADANRILPRRAVRDGIVDRSFEVGCYQQKNGLSSKYRHPLFWQNPFPETRIWRHMTTQFERKNEGWMLMAALVFAALNLRPTLTSIPALLPMIMKDIHLSGTLAGWLNGLPLLAMGVGSLSATVWSARVGRRSAIVGALFLLAAGSALRLAGDVLALFSANIVVGVAIGIAGALTTGVIRTAFAHRAGLVSGLYTTAICAGAALGEGVSSPLADTFPTQWRAASAVWAIPAILAGLGWWVTTRNADEEHGHATGKTANIWRNTIAWQVTVFTGAMSLIAYSLFAWLPIILVQRGMSDAAAGSVVAVSLAGELASALIAPGIAARSSCHLKAIVALSVAAAAGGFIACVFGSVTWVWFWAIVQGLGQGALVSLSILLVILRSPDGSVGVQLSGMSQGVGYMLAGIGPLLLGVLHDMLGDWTFIAWAICAFGLLTLLCGLRAACDETIGSA